MSEKTGSSKRRKALSATLAIAMVATMVLSGTLAYFYQSKAVNTFKSEKKEAYGHDDFIEGKNKDVYVENTGGTDIYVRVKLEESFTHNGETKATTVAHIPKTDRKVENHTGSDGIHDHFQWVLGQEGVTKAFLSATSDQYKDTGDKVIETGEYGKVVKDNSGATYTDKDPTSNTDGVVTTATSAGVITMADYIEMGTPTSETPTEEEIAAAKAAQKAWQGWVMDTNGWVYWSQKVKPGQATGLLLDNVIVDKTIANDQYQYDIDVTFQAVDDSDIGIWTKGLTKLADGGTIAQQNVTLAAKQLLRIIQGEAELPETESAGAKFLYWYADQIEKGNDAAKSMPEKVKKLAAAAEQRYNASLKTITLDNGTTATYHEGFETIDRSTGDKTEEIFVKYDEAGTVEVNNSGLPNKMINSIIERNFGNYPEYFSKKTTITKDLAQGILMIDYDKAPVEDSADPGVASGLAALTYENFPSLIRIYIPKYHVTKDPLKLDTRIAAQLESLDLRENTTITSIDLAGYPNLVNFAINEAENLTEIQNYPDGLLGLGVPGTQVKVDLTDPKFSKLEMLLANGKTLNDQNNLDKLKNHPTLQLLSVGHDTTMDTLDLSGAEKLIFLTFRTKVDKTNPKNILAPSVRHIKFSPKAFSNFSEYVVGNHATGNSVTITVKNCTTLASLDISAYTALKNYPIDLTGCTGLKGVCRRYDQEGFTNYPTTADGIYERIVGVDGKNTYRLHKGSTVTNVTDSAKIAELDANNDMFSNGAA